MNDPKQPERKPTWEEFHAPMHYDHPRPARTAEEWLALDRDELELELKIGAVIGDV